MRGAAAREHASWLDASAPTTRRHGPTVTYRRGLAYVDDRKQAGSDTPA